MKLKGNYDPGTSYDVGDIVVSEGLAYHLQKPAVAGTHPTNTLYWGKVNQNTAEQVLLIMDGVGGVEEKIPTNISEDAILLNGTAEGSDGQYLVTVDDTDPDAPEISVEAVTEGGD